MEVKIDRERILESENNDVRKVRVETENIILDISESTCDGKIIINKVNGKGGALCVFPRYSNEIEVM